MSTSKHKTYWQNRKIDWVKAYCDPENPLGTWNHPHRELIVNKLRNIYWGSLFEIGCASGPNLVKISRTFPGRDIGGIDLSKDAIDTAKKYFNKSVILEVGSGDNILMSDKSTDIVLTDMCLIYVSKGDIGNYLKEIKRIGRHYAIFVEFHHTNPLKRLWLKLRSGYNAYNWKNLLTKHGYYDIIIDKIPESHWPGGNPQKTFGSIIITRI